MFKKIIDWIVNILLSIYNSPVAREMAKSALKTVAKEGVDAATKTLQAVKEAMVMDVTGEEKKDYVINKVKSEYTEIPIKTINQLIENAIGILQDSDFDDCVVEVEEDEQTPQI